MCVLDVRGQSTKPVGTGTSGALSPFFFSKGFGEFGEIFECDCTDAACMTSGEIEIRRLNVQHSCTLHFPSSSLYAPVYHSLTVLSDVVVIHSKENLFVSHPLHYALCNIQ